MALGMGLLGRKLGMTQVFLEEGTRVAVTAIAAGPCAVLDCRTPDRHGYAAVRLAFEEIPQRFEGKPQRLVSRPEAGEFKGAGIPPHRHVREFRVVPEHLARYPVGAIVTVADLFRDGDRVDVTGTSKGRGTQGVMKRHGFGGFPASHGTHEYFRHGGAIGCRLTPGRVHKGKRMSGRLGGERTTVRNLRVVRVLPDRGVLLLEGAVPGASRSLVTVRARARAA